MKVEMVFEDVGVEDNGARECTFQKLNYNTITIGHHHQSMMVCNAFMIKSLVPLKI